LSNFSENVCTTREESVESDGDQEPKDTEGVIGQQAFHHFSLNVESCSETPTKHICRRITNQAGKKKTITTTSSCCFGFKRGRNGFCEKIDLLSMTQIGEQLEAKQFVSSVEKNDLKDMMESNVTVFMPSDDSFEEFSQNVVDNNLDVAPLSNRRNAAQGLTMKNVLLGHVVKGLVNIEDIDNEQILHSEYDNLTIRMNVFPKIRSINRKEDDGFRYLYTANCIPVTKPNRFAQNAIVHKIPRVMLPVTQNVMEIIRDREDMTILRTVLEKTKMDKMLEGISDDDSEPKTEIPKQFSIFAPTDSAFEKIDPQLKRKIKEGAACAQSKFSAFPHDHLSTACLIN
jgi:transforming growth factor-beta-induced protein